MPARFTEAARSQSWLDVAAALAELTIIPAEMRDSSIHGMTSCRQSRSFAEPWSNPQFDP